MKSIIKFISSTVAAAIAITSMGLLSASATNSIVYGDVNGNGKFNRLDVALMFSYIKTGKGTIDEKAADVNCDGKVDNADYELMKKAIKGEISLPQPVDINSALASGQVIYNNNQYSLGSNLSVNSKGESVKEIQRMLNAVGHYGLAVDGIFGQATKSAVMSFQRSKGLTVDGIVGNETYNALVNAYNNLGTSSSTPSYSSATLDLEKMLAYAEAHYKHGSSTNGYNPSYPDYFSITADCANFASQILIAGGLDYDVVYNANVLGLIQKLRSTSFVERYGTKVEYYNNVTGYPNDGTRDRSYFTIDDIEVGDFVTINVNNQNGRDHIMFVIGKSGNQIRIAGHTGDAFYGKSNSSKSTYYIDYDPNGAKYLIRGVLKTSALINNNHEHTFDTSKWSYNDKQHYHAATCGHNEYGKDVADHTFGRATLVSSATCSTPAQYVRRCTVCGYEKTEAGSTLAHRFGASSYEYNENGHYTVKTCSKCGITEKGKLSQHIWAESYTDRITGETIPRKCRICGYEDKGSAHEHTFSSNWSSDFYNHWHAANCGHDVTSDLAAHTFGEWQITNDPTCVSVGYYVRYCTVCNYAQNGKKDALGHNYTSEQKYDSSSHWTQYTCTRCGNTYKGDIHNHNYGDWQVITKETCTTDGKYYHTCSTCGYGEYGTIKATGHDYYVSYLSESSYHQKYSLCRKCGNEIYSNKESHTYSDWIIDREPDVDASGTRHRYCICGHIERQPFGGGKIWGDVNGDGKLSITDVTKLNRYINKQITDKDLDTSVADVNRDEKIDATDVQYIQQAISGLVTLPVNGSSKKMASEFDISDSGVALICELEGFSSTCYPDYSQSSIGYGTKCTGSSTQPHEAGLHTITVEQAMIDMKTQISNTYAPRVRKQMSGIAMTQNQFDALVSLCYNTGGGTSIISSCPLAKYLRGELSESDARNAYSSYYVKAGGSVLQGLINRRNKEADLFFTK